MSYDKTQIRSVGQTFLLKGMAGDHKGKTYPLTANFKIGREQDNNLIINEGFVSRHHAVLKFVSGVLTINDNDSSNGTFVNDQPVKTSLLAEGDIVKFDIIEFVVVAANPPSEEDDIKTIIASPDQIRQEQQQVLERERLAQEKAKQEKAEQERLAQEKAKQEKAEQERLAQEKAKQEKVEQERLAQEKAKQEKVEQERLAQEKAKQEKIEQERLAQEKAKQEKVEQERLAQEKAKQEKVEQERLAQEKVEQENAEQERFAQEKAKQEKVEQERLAQEKVEQENAEQERLAEEKVEQEKVEQERLAQEKAKQEKAEQERLAQEKAKQEKVEQERLAQEKVEQENAEQERFAQEKAKQEKVEQERFAQEKAKQENAEQERLAREQADRQVAGQAEVDDKTVIAPPAPPPPGSDYEKTVISPPEPAGDIDKTVVSPPATDNDKTLVNPASTDDATVAIGQDAVTRIKAAADQNPTDITLIGLTVPIVDRKFKLNKDFLTVGRSPFNDIIIKASSISSRHAEIELLEGIWVVRDLGSSNGSYVNDQLIEECELYSDDSLIFGEVELTFDPDGNNPPPVGRVIDSLDGGVGFSPLIWLSFAVIGALVVAGVVLVL